MTSQQDRNRRAFRAALRRDRVSLDSLIDSAEQRSVRRGPKDAAADMVAGNGYILPRADAAQITLDMDPDRFAHALATGRTFPAHSGTTPDECAACLATAGWSRTELQTRHDLTLAPEACHHNCGHDRRTCRRGVCERWCRL